MPESAITWTQMTGPIAAWQAHGDRRVRDLLAIAPQQLVFVHGFTQGNHSWRPIAEWFVGRGYDCTVVDLPGHGASTNVRADLRRCADLLAATCGAATYIGYSLGGRVALHLAVMFPHLAYRVALIGANPGIVDDDERARRRASDDALAERILEIGVEAFLREWTAQPLFAGLTLSDDDLAERLSNSAEGLAASLRHAGAGNQVPLWDRLRELNMPVLAMAGEHDPAYTAIGRQLAAAIPLGTFATVDGAGHAAHLQQPGQVRARIEHWLSGHPLETLL